MNKFKEITDACMSLLNEDFIHDVWIHDGYVDIEIRDDQVAKAKKTIVTHKRKLDTNANIITEFAVGLRSGIPVKTEVIYVTKTLPTIVGVRIREAENA